jgi:hypothetical protein
MSIKFCLRGRTTFGFLGQRCGAGGLGANGVRLATSSTPASLVRPTAASTPPPSPTVSRAFRAGRARAGAPGGRGGPGEKLEVNAGTRATFGHDALRGCACRPGAPSRRSAYCGVANCVNGTCAIPRPTRQNVGRWVKLTGPASWAVDLRPSAAFEGTVAAAAIGDLTFVARGWWRRCALPGGLATGCCGIPRSPR